MADGQQCWLVSRTRDAEVRHCLRPPGPVRIGRSAADGVLVAHPAVSREHAVLEWTPGAHGGSWRISDCGSASGTSVNGVALLPRRSLALEPGDRIALGPVVLDLVARPDADSETVIARIDPQGAERIDAVSATALDAQHLEAVLEAGASIHAAADPAQVAEAAVDALARASGFTDVACVMLEAGSGAHHVLAARGRGADHVRLSSSVLARARFGPVVVSDALGARDAHRTLARMDIARVVCVPVELGTRLFGLLYVADGGRFRTPLEPVATLARSIASVAALALAGLERLHMTERLEAEQRAMFDGTMQALIASIDAKDPYTRGHSARVADFAHMIAAAAGLPAAERERARLCGLVHDIGKIGVPESVLRKPGRLTAEEFALVAAHPVTGHDILRGIPQITDILPGVLHHHERFAGGGYPHGISGERIPLLGRLIAVADALDAMTTSRTYRGARPVADALAEIERCSGTHFDPAFARAVASIDRRQLQAVVGLHVMGPGSVSVPPVPERRNAAQLPPAGGPGADQAPHARRTA